jgi:predicted permease
MGLLADFRDDLRYTFRTLRREAGFTAFAILIVGLGIGATSTIFSVASALLVRPLLFRDPHDLVWITNGGKDGDMSGQTTQVGYLLDLQAHNKSFSDLASYFAFYGTGDSKLTGNGEPERVSMVRVAQNFFPALGVQPFLGRQFTEAESKWHGPAAVMLSYRIWQRRFASNPAIVGSKMTIDDQPFTVAGVLPESFDFASVFAPGAPVDLYAPFPLAPETNRWGNTLAIIGRLKPGVTVASAQAELDVLAPPMSRVHSEWNGFTPHVTTLEQHVSGRLRPALFVLIGAVGVVMLIVCANLSNLQMARTAARQKEIAIRVALGAASGRLIRQMLTESVLLSCCGAALGLALAFGGTRALSHLEGVNIPLLDTVHVDRSALGFTILMALLSGVLFGLLPALQVRMGTVHGALKENSRGASGGQRQTWVRGTLVVSEIAFACVLLVGAGLLIRSFLRVLDVRLGFEPSQAASIRIDPSRSYRTQEQRDGYFDEALRRAREVHGIQAAGLTDVLPLGRNRTWGAGARGVVYPRDQYPTAFIRIVSDGYFHALGIPLRAGRDFTEEDIPTSKPVVIINETLARRLWPGQNPLGQVIRQYPDREVVGVVGDVRHIALEQDSGAEMYIPIRQTNDYSAVDLVVRASLPPSELAPAIRAALQPIEPNLPANEFRTLQALVDRSVSPRRFVVVLLGGFAAFALILASIGIYALISYSVNQRVREIGIRMALGASASHVRSSILVQTLRLAAIGLAVGSAASWLLARAMNSLLYGVQPDDPITFGAMAVLIVGITAAAGYLPARRASQVDPILALRGD